MDVKHRHKTQSQNKRESGKSSGFSSPTGQSYINNFTYASRHMKEVPSTMTQSYIIPGAERVNIYRNADKNSNKQETLRTSLRALSDLNEQMKQEQQRVKSSVSTFLHGMQKSPSANQANTEKMIRASQVQAQQAKKVQLEREDLKNPRDLLKEYAEKLAKRNQELRIAVDIKTRELEDKEREHEQEIQKCHLQYEAMVRSMTEEREATTPVKSRSGQTVQTVQSVQSAQVKRPNSAARVGVTSKGSNKGSYSPVREPNTASSIRSFEAQKRPNGKAYYEESASPSPVKTKNNNNLDDLDFALEELTKAKEQLRAMEAALFEKEKALLAEEWSRNQAEESNKAHAESLNEHQKEIWLLREKLEDVENERNEIIERFREEEGLRTERYGERIKQLEGAMKKLEELIMTQVEDQKAKAQLIEELRQENEDLKEELEGKQNEIAHQKSEAEKMKRKIKQLEEKSKGESEGDKNREAQEEEQEETQQELEELRGYVAELEAKVQEEEKKYKQMLAQYKKTVQEETALKMEALEEKIIRYRAKKKDYKNKLGESQAEAAGQQQEKEDIVVQMKELEQQMVEYRDAQEVYQNLASEAENVSQENKRLVQKIQELEEKISKSKGKKSGYKQELAKVQEEIVSRQGENENAGAKLKELEASLTKYVEMEEEYKRLLEEVRGELQNEKQEKEEVAAKAGNLEQQMSKLKTKKKDYKKQLSDIQVETNEKEQATQESNVKVGELEEEIKRQNKVIEEYKRKLGDVQEKAAQYEDAQEDGKLLKIRLVELEKELEDLRFQVSCYQQAEQKGEEAASKLNEFEVKVEKYTNKKRDYKKQLLAVQEETSAIRQEKDELAIKVNRLEEELKNKSTAAGRSEEGGFIVREQVIEHTSEKVKQSAPRQEKQKMNRAKLPNSDDDDLYLKKDETEILKAAVQELTEERETLRVKLAEMDGGYTQRIEDLNGEISKRDEHIHALKSDVDQMQAWILEHHGDEVFEKTATESQNTQDINNIEEEKKDKIEEKSEREEQDDKDQSEQDAKSIGTPGTPSNRKSRNSKNAERRKKKKAAMMQSKTQDYSVVYVPKSPPAQSNMGMINLMDASPISQKVKNASNKASPNGSISVSMVVTPRSGVNGDNAKSPQSMSSLRQSRENDPVYKQLEKMIKDLSERLANSSQKTKAEVLLKEEQMRIEAQEREDKLLEEIKKMQEERKEFEKKIDNIQWEHAYEINKLINKEKAQAEKEAAEAEQAAAAEKANAEGKKKKKKKGGNGGANGGNGGN